MKTGERASTPSKPSGLQPTDGPSLGWFMCSERAWSPVWGKTAGAFGVRRHAAGMTTDGQKNKRKKEREANLIRWWRAGDRAEEVEEGLYRVLLLSSFTEDGDSESQ